METLKIVLIDDEENQLISLKSFLARRGHQVYTATDGKAGFDIVELHPIDLVITDYRMPVWDGLTVVKKIKEFNPSVDIIAVTAFGNISDAVMLLKSGAYDYLTKPIDLDELEKRIEHVCERRSLIKENQLLKSKLEQRFQFQSLVGKSAAMDEALSTAGRVAQSKSTVLIRGESGTGKELVARAIHAASPRKSMPFVAINISAYSENLLESELFGHEKGAFTGAISQRIGAFEQASGGTLFIDEIGDIPVSVQVKLLRTLQFATITRVGSSKPIELDVRIVAATHRNLEAMMQEGSFREDLYYRINVVSITLPPLRKRKEDITLLADHFIRYYSAQNSKEVKGLTREALDLLIKYDYPGNIRELQNIIEQAVVLCRDTYISVRDIAARLPDVASENVGDPLESGIGYDEIMKRFEIRVIQSALKKSDGNQSAAARVLGITERHLRSRLGILGLK